MSGAGVMIGLCVVILVTWGLIFLNFPSDLNGIQTALYIGLALQGFYIGAAWELMPKDKV